jgi:hypothetical protein
MDESHFARRGNYWRWAARLIEQHIFARSTQLVMVRIARREQPSATRTRPTPRSKSSVANELDVDVVNSGRSATLLREKVLLSIRSLRQSSCWVRSLHIYVYYDSFDCAFGFDSCSVLFLFSFIYIYRHGRRVAKSFIGVAERVPFGTSRFHCDSRRRIQLEQGNGGFLFANTSTERNKIADKMCPCCAQELIHRQV